MTDPTHSGIFKIQLVGEAWTAIASCCSGCCDAVDDGVDDNDDDDVTNRGFLNRFKRFE